MDGSRNSRRTPRYVDGLPPAARSALLALAEPVTFEAGEPLLLQGDRSGNVVIVRTGLIKVVARSEDRKKVMREVFGPGEVFNVPAYLTGHPTNATAIALDQVTAIIVSRADFAAWLARFPEAAEQLQRDLARRQMEREDDWTATVSMPVGQRLARFMVRFTAEYGEPDPDGRRRVAWLSTVELAGCVGGSARSVTRAMTGWRKRSIVIADGRRSIICRTEPLRRIAGENPEASD